MLGLKKLCLLGLTLEDAWKVSTNCSTKYQWPEDKQLPEETIQEDEQKEKEINEKEKKKKQTKKKETLKKDICAEKPENYLFLLLKDLRCGIPFEKECEFN